MIRTKSEDAVSPVIGVMLMLVVTIIIAAVVAAFAGGVGADAEPAPVTVLNVEGASAGYIETVPGTTTFKEGKKWIDLPSKYYGDENGNQITYTDDESDKHAKSIKYWYGCDSSGNPVVRIAVYFEWDEDNNEWSRSYTSGNSAYEAYGDPKNYEEYLDTGKPTEKQISENTVTINCLHGDSIDLSKASVKVYKDNGNLIHEQKLSDSAKTFGPGDTITVTLNTNSIDFTKGKSVEIEVLYGEHILVSKELTVTSEW